MTTNELAEFNPGASEAHQRKLDQAARTVGQFHTSTGLMSESEAGMMQSQLRHPSNPSPRQTISTANELEMNAPYIIETITMAKALSVRPTEGSPAPSLIVSIHDELKTRDAKTIARRIRKQARRDRKQMRPGRHSS